MTTTRKTSRRHASSPAEIGIPPGDQAQLEQIRQSLARVATAAAEEGAQKAVEKLFLSLGVDLKKPENVIKLQRMFTFLGDLLDTKNTIRKQALRTVVGLAVAGFATLVVIGFKDWIKLPTVTVAIMINAASSTGLT